MAENLKCDHCGSPIRDASSSVQRDGKTYCNDVCANMNKEQSGESKPRTPIV